MSSRPRSARRQANSKAAKPSEAPDADEEFWNQGAFADSDDDASFNAEDESDKGEVSRTTVKAQARDWELVSLPGRDGPGDRRDPRRGYVVFSQ